MSNRRKNNHYHYAEKFDDRRRRSASGRRVFVPFKSVIISLVVLLMFGLICTTFSVYVTENQSDYDPSDPPLVVQARNIKASRDIAVTGANADLAGTGGYNVNWKGRLYFIAPESWNISTYSHLQVAVTRTTSVSTTTHVEFISGLTHLNGRLFTADINSDHSSWNQTEYIAITANNSGWGPGDFALNTCHYYTVPQNYDIKNSSGVYCAVPNSNTNGCGLTFTYYSDGRDKLKKDQTVNLYVGGSKSSSGGKVKLEGYYLSSDSAVTASSSTSTGNSITYSGTLGTVMKMTATVNSGYRFDGFFDSSDNLLTSSTTYSYNISAAKNVKAKYTQLFTVTVANMSGYTGAAPTGGATVDAGQSVTISATVPTGVNFTGWTISGTYTGGSTSSATTTITPTSNVTATANYSLEAPTNLTLSYAAYKVLGYDSYTPNTSSAQTQTATGSGSVLSYSYDIAQDVSAPVTLTKGTDYAVDSSGAVTANVPGKYVVTMTVTDTCYGLTSTATTTATVEVRPVTPVFNYTVSGYTGGIVDGATGMSADTPYKIPINNNHTSDFTITSGLAGIEDYTYSWTTTDNGSPAQTATYSTTTASTNGNRITETVQDPETILHASTAANYTYTVSLIASYNGVSSGTASVTIYYTVTADFLQTKHFNFDNTFDDPDTDKDESKTVQKIYATDNNVSQIYAAFNAGGQDFDTILYFSSDNINFTPIQIFTDQPFTLNGKSYPAQPNDTDHTTLRPYEVHSGTNFLIFNLPVVAQLANTGNTTELINVMQRSGVKYFKAYIDDFRNGNVTAAEPTLHTTVGTSSTGGARPVYFKESTGNTFPNTRLMAYFLDSSGEMTYQTAADYNSVVTQIDDARTDRTGIYRFYAPSDAVSVCFAYSSTNSYVLPYKTGEGDALGFGSDPSVFMAYTDIMTLDSKYNMYKANASTSEANGIKHYTGAWTKLDMDS